MPSLLRAEVALMPSRISGHFTTTFLWILASSRPSLIMAPDSVETTSALISPSTMSQMRADLLRDRIALFGDQRRVGRHTVDDAPCGAFLDFIQIRGIEEKLHKLLLYKRIITRDGPPCASSHTVRRL